MDELVIAADAASALPGETAASSGATHTQSASSSGATAEDPNKGPGQRRSPRLQGQGKDA